MPVLSHTHTHTKTQVVKAKDGAGSATLSMAYAGYLFTSALLKAQAGQAGVVQCAFVENTLTKVGGLMFCCYWGLSRVLGGGGSVSSINMLSYHMR